MIACEPEREITKRDALYDSCCGRKTNDCRLPALYQAEGPSRLRRAPLRTAISTPRVESNWSAKLSVELDACYGFDVHEWVHRGQEFRRHGEFPLHVG